MKLYSKWKNKLGNFILKCMNRFNKKIQKYKINQNIKINNKGLRGKNIKKFINKKYKV